MSTTTLPTLPQHLVPPLEEHAFSETKREVGGVLVGRLTDDGVAISGFIPALKAAGAATHLTFTHEAWADALDVVERDHPGEQIVGWYHTHPSYGLFLSEYDLFIHRNFFSDPRMPALVIDPVAGQMGWFGWRGEDITELARSNTVRPAVEHAVDTQARESDQRSRRGRAGLAFAGAVVLVGAGAFVAGTVAGSQDAELAAAADRIGALQGQIDALEEDLQDRDLEVGALTDTLRQDAGQESPTVADVFTFVLPGDSWWALAERFYNDGFRYPEIAEANPEIQRLEPGDQVRVPDPAIQERD